MYVANYVNYPAYVYVINSATNKIIKTIDVGDFPDDLEYNPNNKRMYVSNGLSGDVTL